MKTAIQLKPPVDLVSLNLGLKPRWVVIKTLSVRSNLSTRVLLAVSLNSLLIKVKDSFSAIKIKRKMKASTLTSLLRVKRNQSLVP